MRILATVSGLLVSMLGATATAEEVGKWYFNPAIGYALLDDDRFVDDDSFVGGSTGRHISERWSAELNIFSGEFDDDFGGSELDLRAVSIDVLRVFNRESRFSPFLSAGVGVISNRQGAITRRNEDPLVQVGGGLLIDLFENSSGSLLFQLRPEIKGRLDFFDRDGVDDFFDTFVSLGFTLAFGQGERKAPAAAVPPPAPPPAPAPVAAVEPPPPPPPPPAPADTDGDGVLDSADRCPDTPRGTAVDATGCTRRGSITLQGVNFETNSATLTQDSRPVLDAVAADLKQYPRLKVEVQGHTDSVGADAYNLGLSQRRAASVREYLLAQAVASDQLTAKGYGETQPVSDNTTPAGRKENRRVVLSVLDNPGAVDVKEAR
jgi:outer membrane protein OmpA-like peptidoglycan-associated protein